LRPHHRGLDRSKEFEAILGRIEAARSAVVKIGLAPYRSASFKPLDAFGNRRTVEAGTMCQSGLIETRFCSDESQGTILGRAEIILGRLFDEDCHRHLITPTDEKSRHLRDVL
jgi:hypothetical protein